MHDTRFRVFDSNGGKVKTHMKWLWGAGTVLVLGTLAFGAVTAPIYNHNYLVEAVITPNSAVASPIVVEEVWSTLVYRDLRRANTLARVFGEALHFEFDGDDYFILKRAGTSAGAYDLLAECLEIDTLSDYSQAGPPIDCTIIQLPPMVVKVDDRGVIERIPRDRRTGTYPEFTISVNIAPTNKEPAYELVEQFPWIGELPPYEASVLPTPIPESGLFVPARHYQKDFVVKP